MGTGVAGFVLNLGCLCCLCTLPYPLATAHRRRCCRPLRTAMNISFPKEAAINVSSLTRVSTSAVILSEVAHILLRPWRVVGIHNICRMDGRVARTKKLLLYKTEFPAGSNEGLVVSNSAFRWPTSLRNSSHFGSVLLTTSLSRRVDDRPRRWTDVNPSLSTVGRAFITHILSLAASFGGADASTFIFYRTAAGAGSASVPGAAASVAAFNPLRLSFWSQSLPMWPHPQQLKH